MRQNGSSPCNPISGTHQEHRQIEKYPSLIEGARNDERPARLSEKKLLGVRRAEAELRVKVDFPVQRTQLTHKGLRRSLFFSFGQRCFGRIRNRNKKEHVWLVFETKRIIIQDLQSMIIHDCSLLLCCIIFRSIPTLSNTEENGT